MKSFLIDLAIATVKGVVIGAGAFLMFLHVHRNEHLRNPEGYEAPAKAMPAPAALRSDQWRPVVPIIQETDK